MLKISKKVVDRIRDGVKRYQKIVCELRERDVSEADTVTVVKDILADVFGFDKYLELTGEYQIRGTYCDLAVKIENKIKYLIEVKAAGVDLNDAHLRQVVDYAAKEGIEWAVLTNGINWRLHRIKFAQPISHEEVASFSILELDLRKDDDKRKAFLLTREAVGEGAMDAYHQHAQLLNRYTVTQVLLSDPVVTVLRREFRKLFPDIKVDCEELKAILSEEILKRDVVENEKAKDAGSRVRKASRKLDKKATKQSVKKAAEEKPSENLAQDSELVADADGADQGN